MSKERAQRRAEREREAAQAAAVRAAEAERVARRDRRRQLLVGWIPRPAPAPSGSLAARRRRDIGLVLTGVFALNVLVLLASDGWELRSLVLLLSVLLTPVALLLISQK
ncbi:hypothetical protein BH09ACT12_BH09ACT12_03250 [soil metagenome]